MIGATALTNLSPHLIAFTRAAAAAAEMFRVIDRPSQIDPLSTAGHRPAEVTGEIEVSGVDFSYPSRPDTQVLSDFSLKIPAGQVTALVVGLICSIACDHSLICQRAHLVLANRRS